MDKRALAIFSPVCKRIGDIYVDLLPCDKNGTEGPWDDDDPVDPFVDDPNELLNTSIVFSVCIQRLEFDFAQREGSRCKYNSVWVR
eukprot:NODE_16037_length_316_cov_3.408240_g14871_i0.p2 GENE.NODE_16037_length_316_cov_3.408240_g14871_i0~~NODE_16037_length_316_cov_3.408240_g14871_i0.p2  ORF type:complete len:95 (-),score=18.94 NODE_16037_length_316_cov_3.408240_g14871_i0:32-289(-)